MFVVAVVLDIQIFNTTATTQHNLWPNINIERLGDGSLCN